MQSMPAPPGTTQPAPAPAMAEGDAGTTLLSHVSNVAARVAIPFLTGAAVALSFVAGYVSTQRDAFGFGLIAGSREGFRQGHQQGFADGYHAGHHDGWADATSSIGEDIEALCRDQVANVVCHMFLGIGNDTDVRRA